MVVFVLAIGAITWLSSRALGLDAAATAAMLLCAMFMNAGNYGLPVARFAFGQEGFERAALFFAVQVILAQTLAIYIAGAGHGDLREGLARLLDRKSTRLNSSHANISYAVFCLKRTSRR